MRAYSHRITSHGERQLELKLGYPLSDCQRTTHYALDLYLFTPAQLDITAGAFSSARFLRNIHSYTRYSTPSLTLAQLLAADCDVSPLVRIRSFLDTGAELSPAQQERILYELRVLCVIAHRQLKSRRIDLQQRISGQQRPESIEEDVRLFLDELNALLAAFRVLMDRFADPRVSDILRSMARRADEMLSLISEKMILRLYETVQDRNDYAGMQALLHPLLHQETEYRRRCGYLSLTNRQAPRLNEATIYREGLLKKWMESCMYMNREQRAVGSRWTQILAGIAAGTAMAFAVAATFLATQWLPGNTLPMFALLVVIYILKDRMKEGLRNIFLAVMPRMIADRTEDLIDPASERVVGSTRTRARHCPLGRVPAHIRALRDSTKSPLQAILPDEDVIHFHKDVHIHCRRLQAHHQRLEGLTEILRIQLAPWLGNMDDPYKSLRVAEGERVERIDVERVYHVHAVMTLRDLSKTAPPEHHHYCVVLNRDGLVRIEERQS